MRLGILIGLLTLIASVIITIILNLMGLPIFFFAFFLPLVGMPLIIKEGIFEEKSPVIETVGEIKYCPVCGAKLSGWENYCPQCGHKLR